MRPGILALRIVAGGLLAGHGLQKLTGSFGGGGLEATEKIMGSMQMHPAKANARAAARTETFGGAAIVAGVATPVAAAGLIAVMTTAIRKVHLKNGVWASGGGFEYNAVLIAALTAIAAEGPGLLSFDAIVGKRRWGTFAGVFALVAGVAGSTLVIEAAKRLAPPADEVDGSVGAETDADADAEPDAETGADEHASADAAAQEEGES